MNDEVKPEKNDTEQKTDKDKSLILLVGSPASGKSTWGKKFADEKGLVYVCFDNIRAEIGTGENDQSVSAAAFAVARQRVSQALASGKSVMIDGKNVTRKTRKDWVKLGREHGAYIIAVVFEVPREELLRRNAARERQVKPEVIDDFIRRFQRPTEPEVDKVISK